jgi:hypothetical protein
MRKERLPVELAYFVPEPTIILFGCRPLVPFQPGWHDRPAPDGHYRAPTPGAKPGDRPWPSPLCPVCKGRIGRPEPGRTSSSFISELDHRTYCELCGSMDPRNEANARAQRIAEQARSRHDHAVREVERVLKLSHESLRRPRLSEAERRRIWNGYKGGILSPSIEVTNRARVGREFLIRIKQEPNWNLVLDATGRAIPAGRAHESMGSNAH